MIHISNPKKKGKRQETIPKGRYPIFDLLSEELATLNVVRASCTVGMGGTASAILDPGPLP